MRIVWSIVWVIIIIFLFKEKNFINKKKGEKNCNLSNRMIF